MFTTKKAIVFSLTYHQTMGRSPRTNTTITMKCIILEYAFTYCLLHRVILLKQYKSYGSMYIEIQSISNNLSNYKHQHFTSTITFLLFQYPLLNDLLYVMHFLIMLLKQNLVLILIQLML